MPQPHIIANCPRCGNKKMTFDINGSSGDLSPRHHFKSWEEFQQNCSPDEEGNMYELFTICRHCKRTVVFVIAEDYDWEKQVVIKSDPPMNIKGSLNGHFVILDFVKIRDNATYTTPEFISENIEKIFKEGTACLSIECWNAAGAMFRLCLDLMTKDMISKEDPKSLTKNVKNKLAPRIDWLFANKKLPEDLEDIAGYIRKDGNDGAHDGTLTKDDAEDLFDFTSILLERTYTEPEKIKYIENRRARRKANPRNPFVNIENPRLT